jgi:hypothetical protein
MDGLNELMDKQLAVVSRGQLLALGMTDNAMQYRVRSGGPWQVLLPGVYLGLTGTPDLRQKEVAALLYAGPVSLITGPVALMHDSISSPVGLDAIDVLVPAKRQCSSTGFVRIHRTTRMPAQLSAIGPVRLVLTPRAVADTVRQLTSLRDVRAVVADAVQLGRCTISQLGGELANGPVRGSAKFRSVLAEVADGIRSTAEGDLGDRFIAKPDAWWPKAGVACEVDSRQWHLSPDAWERTMSRHDLMGEIGIIPLHFSPSQIRREPATVVQRIKGALTRGLTCPPLPIRTVPCPTTRSPGQ